jgi:hypothetical protein
VGLTRASAKGGSSGVEAMLLADSAWLHESASIAFGTLKGATAANHAASPDNVPTAMLAGYPYVFVNATVCRGRFVVAVCSLFLV